MIFLKEDIMIFIGVLNSKVWRSPPGEGQVYVFDENNMVVQPLPSVGAGFSWGYSGQGASNLASALLLKISNDEELVKKLHTYFVDEYIESMKTGCWALHKSEIQSWIDSKS